MRILPSTILNPDTPDGERRVRALLAAAPGSPGAFAVHSLNLPEHAYKRYGEADFVVVDRRGILVVEVKGGIVRHSGGVWRFENGRGQAREKSEGPHRQAESGVHALLRSLSRSDAPKIGVFGWAVATPFTFWTTPHPEIPAEVLIDRGDCGDPAAFTAALDRAFRWWRMRSIASGRQTTPLDTQVVERLLLPEFQFAPAPARCAEAVQRDVVRLTERQAEILEGLSDNPRLLVEGGAGTGKTVLAAAAASQAASAGEAVGLVVAAPVLAAHLASGLPRVTVMAPGAMGDLPAHSLDVLVVDEGQELANPAGLRAADRLLRGGLAAGRWRWFMDPANQALHAEVTYDALQQLRSIATKYRLRRNVRSTKQIVSLVQGTVGADVGVSEIDSRGVLPRVEHVPGNPTKCLLAAVEQARDWLDGGVAPGDIGVLGAEADLPNLLAAARHILGDDVVALDGADALSMVQGRVIVTDPSTFRGMERAWVTLGCTPTFAAQARSESFLYVAMTRARAGLAVFVADGADTWFTQLQMNNGPRVLQTGR